jgi:hypothetical protein
MVDPNGPQALELVAAYLGANPAELELEWRQAATLGAVAARYGRPVVGLEELVAETLGRAGSRG